MHTSSQWVTSKFPNADHFRNLRSLIAATWAEYSFPLVAAFILTLVVYSYFFTTIVLTNHTFPNAWVRDYPGSSTLSEGRWFNDIILQLGGGGGVQALQMSLACAVQVVNALLFAFLLRVSSKPGVFLMAAFLSLHPAILDYYSFASDHLYFVIGDSLALLGTLALDRIDDRRLSLPLATLCFFLTLATYPSKGALIGVLLVMWCILWSIGPEAEGPGRWQRLFRNRLIPAALTFGLALILFYLSSKLVVTHPSVNRTHVNDAGTVVRQILRAYPEVIQSFTSRVDYLPHLLRFIPALAVLVGVVAIVWQSLRARGLTLAALALLAAIPIALQFSYIVNEDTWANVGRILSPQAYVLLFFIAVAWRTALLRPIATVLVAVMIYFFCIVGSQEANAAALKTIYDTAKLNRIVLA